MNTEKEATLPENTIKVEDQFNKYLSKVKLDARKMPSHQLRELRRCFYGAWGQQILIHMQDLPKMDAKVASDNVYAMLKEVGDFWELQKKE